MIAICAAFTAEPLAESLRYWLDWLQMPEQIEFAPYSQVVQTLLDAGGVFARNANGLNVVLLRFEDLKQTPELIPALRTATSISASPILVCVCPAAPHMQGPASQWERELEIGLCELPSIRYLSSSRLMELYTVARYYDAASDRLGHMPYTPEAYAAMGTAIVRAFHSSRRPPFKVVVADCDNTLWRGVCGESGPHGIELDRGSRALQSFLKARQNEGMLLCVCSKNAGEDVEQTFDAHPEMPLGRADFIGWRVNWQPKPENIESLAAELSLGLDSFIFVDDNPMETAEVAARCPGVLALTLPANPDLIPRFLDHVWAFDRSGVTGEDRKRTAMYRDHATRQRVLAESLTYADFLRALELQVEIRELNGAAEMERAAQMTMRTNQFNFTTRRFSEPGLRQALSGGSTRILAAFVRDRYGDYGQVGLAMYEVTRGALHVENFLLSCRVLGKGVEHAMLARLGQTAMECSLSAVEINCVPTAKNTPARNFLASVGAEYRTGDDGPGLLYRFPAQAAAAVRFSAPEEEPRAVASDHEIHASVSASDFAWIATHRSDAASVLNALNEARGIRVVAPATNGPRDDRERRIAQIWERVLRISPIGIHDNFFDLGGDSLLAVRILADLSKVTERDLPLVALIESPTIAQLAKLARGAALEPAWKCLVPMKISGGRPPFYCVHGVGGNVLEFMDLARRMDSDQPFYGIQAIGLTGAAPAGKLTVEEMARHYQAEICQAQPEGPYYLGGSSFGGLIAYEMARQLAGAGQPVGLVALFDTSVPGSTNSAEAGNGFRMRMEAMKYRLSLHWGNLLLLAPRERMAYARGKLRRAALRNGAGEIIRSVAEAGQWAASAYVPGKYAGGITLFRATEQPPWIVSDRTLGWGNLVQGGVEIYDTPGHHADLVRDPRARVLARQLDDALRKARGELCDLSASVRDRN